MYLVDTNVWLEIILRQERFEEARRFVEGTPSEELAITDFAFPLHMLLTRLGQAEAFRRFAVDTLVDGAVRLLTVPPSDVGMVTSAMTRFSLDFDDAYQYAVAAKLNFEIVSFDSDFDRTDRKRKLPGEIQSQQ